MHTDIPPKVTNYCQTIHSHEGGDITLQVWASGYPRPKVSWFYEGRKVESDYCAQVGANGTLTFVHVEPRRAGLYHFTVTNCAGSVDGEMRLVVHAVDDEAAFPMLESKPVPVMTFREYVASLHHDGGGGFDAQFEVNKLAGAFSHLMTVDPNSTWGGYSRT